MATKIDWISAELMLEEYNITTFGVERILSGHTDSYDEDLVDFVHELDSEWDQG